MGGMHLTTALSDVSQHCSHADMHRPPHFALWCTSSAKTCIACNPRKHKTKLHRFAVEVYSMVQLSREETILEIVIIRMLQCGRRPLSALGVNIPRLAPWIQPPYRPNSLTIHHTVMHQALFY